MLAIIGIIWRQQWIKENRATAKWNFKQNECRWRLTHHCTCICISTICCRRVPCNPVLVSDDTLSASCPDLVLQQTSLTEWQVTGMDTEEDMSVGHGTLNFSIPFSAVPSERQIQIAMSFSTFILLLIQSWLLTLLAAKLLDLSKIQVFRPLPLKRTISADWFLS